MIPRNQSYAYYINNVRIDPKYLEWYGIILDVLTSQINHRLFAHGTRNEQGMIATEQGYLAWVFLRIMIWNYTF